MFQRYVEAGICAASAYVAYALFGWVGFAVASVFVLGLLIGELVRNQQETVKTLLSRLPDRCACCHREIVDEGGIIDDDGIVYHDACMEKIEAMGLSANQLNERSGATRK